jgi:antitoxin (DNA-binding transcriptional repressor) of toxin-antitoxin stability system
MDEVAETREPIVITKRGHPVCQLMPYRPKPKTLFGISRETLVIKGDILSPIDIEWESAE